MCKLWISPMLLGLGVFLGAGFDRLNAQVTGSESARLTLAQAPSAGNSEANSPAAKGAKVISEDEAKKIALKAVPGKVIDVAIEKKRGANRYVVEVVPEKGGKEVDVIINMTTGKVIAIEN